MSKFYKIIFPFFYITLMNLLTHAPYFLKDELEKWMNWRNTATAQNYLWNIIIYIKKKKSESRTRPLKRLK